MSKGAIQLQVRLPDLFTHPGTVLYVGANALHAPTCAWELKQVGHELTLLEIWPQNAAHYQGGGPFAHVVCGDVRRVDEIPLPRERYDVALWWHGIEHLVRREVEVAVRKEKLACIMRVKNEALKLARCLASMPFVDQFVIVDNGSDDDTVEIASAYTATILHTTDLNANYDMNLAYAEAKKQGATWCLWMDADEEWEAKAADQFRDLLKPGPINGWVFRVYPFVMSYPYYRIDRGWAQFTMRGQMRLFRAQDGIHWNDPRPSSSGLPRGLRGAIGKSDLRIKHWTIETEEELERKLRFYSGLYPGRDFSHLRNGPDAVYKKFIE